MKLTWFKFLLAQLKLYISKQFSSWNTRTHVCIYTHKYKRSCKFAGVRGEYYGGRCSVECVTHYCLRRLYLLYFFSPFIEHQVDMNWLERSLLVFFDWGTYCVSYCHIGFIVFYPVIRAKVKEIKTKCHDVTAVVEVKEILKASLVNIPRETVNLYTSSGCLCPPLNVNEEYLIMGYEDEERSR